MELLAEDAVRSRGDVVVSGIEHARVPHDRFQQITNRPLMFGPYRLLHIRAGKGKDQRAAFSADTEMVGPEPDQTLSKGQIGRRGVTQKA